jgi:hypothetical protein
MGRRGNGTKRRSFYKTKKNQTRGTSQEEPARGTKVKEPKRGSKKKKHKNSPCNGIPTKPTQQKILSQVRLYP